MADDTAQYNIKPRITPDGTIYDISLLFATNGIIPENRRSYSDKQVAWITDAHGTHLLLPAAKIVFGEAVGKTAKTENAIEASMSVTTPLKPKFLIDDGYATPPIYVDEFIINQENGFVTFETFESDFNILIRVSSFWSVRGVYYMNMPDGTIASMVIPESWGGYTDFNFNLTNVPTGYVFKIWASDIYDMPENEYSSFWNKVPFSFLKIISIQNAGIKRFDMQWNKRNFESLNFSQLDLSNNALNANIVNKIIEEYALGVLSWGGVMNNRVELNLSGGTSAAPSGKAISLGQQLVQRYNKITISHNGTPWEVPSSI